MSLRAMHLIAIASLLAVVGVAIPFMAHAEEAADVRAAIMTEVLRDPRTASVPPEQLAAIIDALTEQVQAQAITSADILWHPDDFWKANTAAQAAAEYFPRQCDPEFGILCPFNQAFGFAGADSNLPQWLFVLSAVLLLLLPRVRKELEAKHAPAPTA